MSAASVSTSVPGDTVPGRPFLLNPVLKLALYAGTILGISYALIFFVPPLSLDSASLAFILGAAALLVWPAFAGLARQVQILVVRSYLHLTPRGIRLRYWSHAGAPIVSLYIPWYRMVKGEIPWRLFVRCEAHMGSDRWSTWGNLTIETTVGSYEIRREVFSAKPAALMAAIGDYREVAFNQIGRDRVEVAKFQRRRYQTPVRVGPPPYYQLKGSYLVIHQVARAMPLLCVLLILAAGFMFALGMLAKGLWTQSLIVAGISAVPCGIGALIRASLDRKRRKDCRCLEFRGEGIACGLSWDQLRLIRWENIRFARLVLGWSQFQQGAWGKPVTVTSTFLRVGLSGASVLVLGPETSGPLLYRQTTFDRSLAELAELIDPPWGKVAAVLQLIGRGCDLETAISYVGLPKLHGTPKAEDSPPSDGPSDPPDSNPWAELR